ncbi:hypothetical protein [Pseudoduganella sp. OTU4001]|uniref:hypothetical protein n=1 Tax=Pseudoduganella sp. OTU4001 TaxID=3043854 RepID=UPI00313D0D33
MEHDEALLDNLAALRAAHDKASRQLADITALAASALKGRGTLPSLVQLQNYAQALSQAQRQAAHCEDLMLGRPAPATSGKAAGSRPYVH